MRHLIATTAAGLVLGAVTATSALAQVAAPLADQPIIACPTQQDLDQVVGSDGGIQPDDCTTIDINRLESNGVELCLIDFGMEEGFLNQLRDAAFSTQWWVRCDQLSAVVL